MTGPMLLPEELMLLKLELTKLTVYRFYLEAKWFHCLKNCI